MGGSVAVPSLQGNCPRTLSLEQLLLYGLHLRSMRMPPLRQLVRFQISTLCEIHLLSADRAALLKDIMRSLCLAA